MVTYILLVNWTEQGVKNVKDTVKRADDARKLGEKLGGRLTSLYWTQGSHDLIGVLEAPDEATANAITLAISMSGSVRTESLRAYSGDKMQRVLDKLP